MNTTRTATYGLPMQQDVAAFHDAFDMPNLVATPGPLPLDRIELRIGLLREEGIVELRQAVEKRDPVLVIDALIDTVYVTLGALVEMGHDASNPLSHVNREERPFNLDILMDTASGCVIAYEMYLAMLEAAFRRQDTTRSVELLDTILNSAIFTLLNAGIDPQPFFDEVQRANMSKLGADGKPIHSRGVDLDGYPAGKVLKGENYSPPDLAAVYARLYGPRDSVTLRPAVSADFERGARETAAAMRLYFLNENEAPMYNIGVAELENFEQGAIADAIRDERQRIQRDQS
jgi:predicted HAD superfamily Cof-like phosphohydrolase